MSTNEAYLVNGVDLSSMAWRIGVAEGLQDGPELRGEDIIVPTAHGSLDPHGDPGIARRRYGPGTIRFSMWVAGVDPFTGLGPVADDDVSIYLARIDELQKLFNARTLTLTHERIDGDRTATARLAAPLRPVREPSSPLFGRFVADCVIPAAFWRDTTTTTVSATVATGTAVDLSALAGNAPLTDATVTFGPCANPELAQGGAYVKYNGTVSSGRQLVIPCGTWGPLDDGAGTAWTPSLAAVEYMPGPSWLELDPTADPFEATFTHTGGGTAAVSVTGYRKWLTS